MFNHFESLTSSCNPATPLMPDPYRSWYDVLGNLTGTRKRAPRSEDRLYVPTRVLLTPPRRELYSPSSATVKTTYVGPGVILKTVNSGCFGMLFFGLGGARKKKHRELAPSWRRNDLLEGLKLLESGRSGAAQSAGNPL